MSTKSMITYKRKRVTSHAHTTDGTIPRFSAASSSLAPTFGVDANNSMLNDDDVPASTKQKVVGGSIQQSIKEEIPLQSAHATEKERKEIQLCEALPKTEQTNICCAAPASRSAEEACKNKLQCTAGTDSPIPASSSVYDLLHFDGTINRTEEFSTFAPAGIDSYQGLNYTTRHNQCKNQSGPLLTFRRRVKKKINLDEPADEKYSKANGKQCSAMTCSQPSSSLNNAPSLKETDGNSLHTEDKVTKVETSIGLSVSAEHLVEQNSSHILKSSVQHMVPPQPAEDVNQSLPPELDGTPVSEFTSAREISEPDARVESSKTLANVLVVPKVFEVKRKGHDDGQTSSPQSPRQQINVNWLKPTNKSVPDDLLESQGSTKNVPIIVSDDFSDERGKDLENSDVLDQVVQEKNKSRFALAQINLNHAELPQESLLVLDDSSVQRLPDQDQSGSEQKQVFGSIERLFFTKEKDAIYDQQQQHEGTSSMRTSYSNFFDPTPSWDAGSFKEPRSMPSELKFRIMDKVPEFNLDLSLDSFPDNSVSSLKRNKLFHEGNSCGSHLLTERLGTYSYKRHPAPWSEEELDFLWIGVRRYGTNNWNAMLKDTRLRFSNSRVAEDLSKQWNKEQKKLLGGVDLLQSIRVSAMGYAPAPHIVEDYAGSSSCSGCSNSPFLTAKTDLSLGDVYLRGAHASERGQHHLSSLGILNLHGIDTGPRNLSLGGFPVASSSYGRSGSRRRRAPKFHRSRYGSRPLLCQEASERVSQQVLPINQQPINSLPQWLTKVMETGTSRPGSEMWPSMQAPGHHPLTEPLNDGLPPLRTASLFPDDVKPHVLPDASLKRVLKRKTEWRSVSKKLFRTGDALDLNQRSAAMAGPGPNGGATASDAGASSEETVSDS